MCLTLSYVDAVRSSDDVFLTLCGRKSLKCCDVANWRNWQLTLLSLRPSRFDSIWHQFISRDLSVTCCCCCCCCCSYSFLGPEGTLCFGGDALRLVPERQSADEVNVFYWSELIPSQQMVRLLRCRIHREHDFCCKAAWTWVALAWIRSCKRGLLTPAQRQPASVHQPRCDVTLFGGENRRPSCSLVSQSGTA